MSSYIKILKISAHDSKIIFFTQKLEMINNNTWKAPIEDENDQHKKPEKPKTRRKKR